MVASRGFSLSLGEGILVFIVAALVIALGYKLFSARMANYRAKRIVNEIQVFIPRIQAAYINKNSFEGLNSTLVAQSRWVNDSIIDKSDPSNPSLKTQWGPLQINAFVGKGGGDDQEANVVMHCIPERECMLIAEAFSGHTVRDVRINGATVKQDSEIDVDLTKAAEECEKGKAHGNTIDFFFGRS